MTINLRTLPNNYNDDALTVDVVIEIPKGSRIKYEIDEEGVLRVDRVFNSSFTYPYNYGFIPNTLCKGDGDPIDAIIISEESYAPTSVLKTRIVGKITTWEGEDTRETKLVVVPLGEESHQDIDNISELPEYLRCRIEQFIARYKELEGKDVQTDGLENVYLNELIEMFDGQSNLLEYGLSFDDIPF